MVHLGRRELRWEDCSREGASKDGPLGEKGTEVRGVQREGASKDGALREKGTEVEGNMRSRRRYCRTSHGKIVIASALQNHTSFNKQLWGRRHTRSAAKATTEVLRASPSARVPML
jgi:hypothetical protein